MKYLGTIAGLLALAVATTPASASAQTTVDYNKKSDAELDAAFEALGDDWLEDSCNRAMPLLSEMHRRHREPELERSLLLASAVCFDERKDYGAAAEQFDRLDERFGSSGLIGMALYFDMRTDDADGMLDRLGKMTAKGDPADFASIPTQTFFESIRLAHRTDRSADFAEIALRLHDSPGFIEFAPDVQEAVAFRALKPVMAAGDLDRIPEILGLVRSPSNYPDLLAAREYESIWPQVEARVGEHFGLITPEYREWAMARLENEPTDRDRFSDAAHALLYDGRYAEAVALAQQWRHRPQAFEKIQEGDGWAINVEAYALDALGRTAEADVLFDRLAELDAPEHPWVVNFVINRAVRLVGQGRWSEGLEAARLARSVADDYGSTYAKMLVANALVCAHAGLGNLSEAEGELAYLRENRLEALAVAADGLMCAKRNDEALAMLLDGFEHDRTRPMVIEALMPAELNLYHIPSDQPSVRDFLETSPELRAAFERHARIVPEKFYPAAASRQNPPAS